MMKNWLVGVILTASSTLWADQGIKVGDEFCQFRPANFYEGIGTDLATAFVRSQLVVGSSVLMQAFSDKRDHAELRAYSKAHMDALQKVLSEKAIEVLEKDTEINGVVLQQVGDFVISPNPINCTDDKRPATTVNPDVVDLAQCFGLPRIVTKLEGQADGFSFTLDLEGESETELAEEFRTIPTAFILRNVTSRRLQLDLEKLSVKCDLQDDCITHIPLKEIKITWDLDIRRIDGINADFSKLDLAQQLEVLKDAPSLGEIKNLSLMIHGNEETEQVELMTKTCMVEMDKPKAEAFKAFFGKMRGSETPIFGPIGDVLGGVAQMAADAFIPKVTLLDPNSGRTTIPRGTFTLGYDEEKLTDACKRAVGIARNQCEMATYHPSKKSKNLYFLHRRILDAIEVVLYEDADLRDELRKQVEMLIMPRAFQLANGPLQINKAPLAIVAQSSVPAVVDKAITGANKAVTRVGGWLNSVREGALSLFKRERETEHAQQ